MFIGEWWAGLTLTIHVDKEDFDKYFGKEHGIVLMNHTYEIDWLIGYIFCNKIKVLGVSKL